MEGYIYIEDSKVVWNPKKRPRISTFFGTAQEGETDFLFHEAFKQWQSECVEVENVFKGFGKQWCITTVIDEGDYDQIITPGQKATIEGKAITKIL